MTRGIAVAIAAGALLTAAWRAGRRSRSTPRSTPHTGSIPSAGPSSGQGGPGGFGGGGFGGGRGGQPGGTPGANDRRVRHTAHRDGQLRASHRDAGHDRRHRYDRHGPLAGWRIRRRSRTGRRRAARQQHSERCTDRRIEGEREFVHVGCRGDRLERGVGISARHAASRSWRSAASTAATLAHTRRSSRSSSLRGKIHYFIAGSVGTPNGGSNASSEISSWVSSHYTAVTIGGVTLYDLTKATS